MHITASPEPAAQEAPPVGERIVWVLGRCDPALAIDLAKLGWNLQSYAPGTFGPPPPVLLACWSEGDPPVERPLVVVEAHDGMAAVFLAPPHELERVAALAEAHRLMLVPSPTTTTLLAHALSVAARTSRLEALAADATLTDWTCAGPLVGQSTAIRRARLRMSDAYLSGTPVWLSGPNGSCKQWMLERLHEASAAGSPLEIVDCATLDRFAQARVIESAARRLAPTSGGMLCLQRAEHLDETVNAVERALRYRVHLACWTRETECEAPSGYCHVEIPPLVDRPLDVLWVAHTLLTSRRLVLDSEAATLLQSHAWPGNYLELREVVERAADRSRGGCVRRGDLALGANADHHVSRARDQATGMDLREVQELAIERALETTNGCKAQAARMLGIARTTLYRRLRASSTGGRSGRRST